MDYTYKTEGVCSMMIKLHIEDDIISDVEFVGGCNGNLKAISKLVEGMSVDQIEKTLSGNICGMKGTSCADQLAKAARAAYEEAHK